MRTLWMLIGIAMCAGSSAVLHAQGSGAAAAAVCLTCHGPAALSAPPTPGAPPFPSLDGQHADYLEKQLRAFKAGKRKNDLMAPILAGIRKGQFSQLAAHFASQAPARQTAANPQLAAAGRTLYEEGNQAKGIPACVGCHLPGAAGTEKYPRLAGQRQAYVVQQLTNFRNGVRTTDRAHVMRSVAKPLSDDEMRAVAEYVAGL